MNPIKLGNSPHPSLSVRQVVIALNVAFWICSLLSSRQANAGLVSMQSPSSSDSSQKITWQSCPKVPSKSIQCAQVQVPLDWAHPAGPKISLSVARHLASKPDERIGSLFLNYGGPGVAGVPVVEEAGDELDKLGGGRFDVVSWDPRGTGESTHVRCFDNTTKMERFWGEDWTIPTTPLSLKLYVPKTLEFAQRCAAFSGSLLEHISTEDTVRDLDYLRQLVGDSQLTYRGLSYGTFLGETYINMFPHLVRAVVLDANIDPVPFTASVEAAMSSSGSDTDLVFEKFLSLCQQAGPLNCKLAGGDVKARVNKLLARLRQGSIPAPRAPAPHELRYGDVQIAIWMSLGGPSHWPQLADDLNQAADGDGSNLAIALNAQRTSSEQSLISATALQCADKPLPPPGLLQTWPQVMQRLTATNFLGNLEGWWLWAPCASWQAGSAQRYTGPWNAITANPILVVGNRYDPRTKYANSVLASQRLGNAALLTLDGYGHTSDVDPSACIDAAVTQYLITKTTPPTGTVCQPDRTPYDPDFGTAVLRGPPVD